MVFSGEHPLPVLCVFFQDNNLYAHCTSIVISFHWLDCDFISSRPLLSWQSHLRNVIYRRELGRDWWLSQIAWRLSSLSSLHIRCSTGHHRTRVSRHLIIQLLLPCLVLQDIHFSIKHVPTIFIQPFNIGLFSFSHIFLHLKLFPHFFESHSLYFVFEFLPHPWHLLKLFHLHHIDFRVFGQPSQHIQGVVLLSH